MKERNNSKDLQKEIIKPQPVIATLSQRRRFLCPRDPESCSVGSIKLLVHSERFIGSYVRRGKNEARYSYLG